MKIATKLLGEKQNEEDAILDQHYKSLNCKLRSIDKNE